MAEPENQGTVVKESPDIKANLGKLPLAEKILALVAILVVIGWIIAWSGTGGWVYQGLFKSWFATLSFFGALSVATVVILKLFGIRPIPPDLERHVIPVASLLPVVGFVLEAVLRTPAALLTIGGSLALAYLSATTYWRKHIPEIAMQPLGKDAAAEPPAQPPAA